MIRAVIDTNVLVSGLLKPSGHEALILLAVHQGLVRACVSRDILQEYAEVLARPKFAFPPAEIAAVIAMFHAHGDPVDPTHDDTVLPDPDDAMFLRCARAAGAAYIVTGNKRHVPADACGAIRVVSAGELIDRITLEI